MRVIYFSSSTCAPCKALKPAVQQVSSELGVPVEYIDVDTFKDYAQSYQITSVPTLIGINGTTQVFRHTGMASISQLKSMFTK